MSAAEHPSSNSSQSPKRPVKKPLKRPSLRQPLNRSSDDVESADPADPEMPSPVGTQGACQQPEAPQTIEETPPPSTEAASSPSQPASSPTPVGQHPISAPSEPMQYRAIGLVRGTYIPQEEQLNRGALVTEDGIEIDSVLLGRVTSLIKNHIDLTASHLWVVYPRTREAEGEENSEATDLHLQIVGVWEPETLGMPGESPKVEGETAAEESAAEESAAEESAAEETTTEESTTEESAAEETTAEETTTEESTAEETATPEPTISEATEQAAETPENIAASSEALPEDTGSTPAEDSSSTPATENLAPETPGSEADASETSESSSSTLPSENYFSIRGEVLKCSEDDGQILVKILQGAKRASDKAPKAFRVHVSGQITGKTVGYFWELDVERQGKQLRLLEGRTIGIVPPKKKKKRRKGPPTGLKRQFKKGGGRPKPSTPQPKTKPRIRPSAPVKSNPL